MSAASDGISRDIEQIASTSKEISISSEQTTQAAAELTKLSVIFRG
jgi:methyl-accepting chemotaxis protein